MNWFQRLTGRAPTAQRIPSPTAGSTGQGRPTYALATPGITSTLPRHLNFELLRQFYRAIPLMGRAVDILAGFTGTPALLVDGNEAATEELNAWAKSVPFGHIGSGLKAWAYDHLAQALVYGYGVGEVEGGIERDGVPRLWSYPSPSFGFQTDETGGILVVQEQRGRGLVALNPETVILSTHRPEGCDPNGTSLFFSSGTFCQAWLDLVY